MGIVFLFGVIYTLLYDTEFAKEFENEAVVGAFSAALAMKVSAPKADEFISQYKDNSGKRCPIDWEQLWKDIEENHEKNEKNID